MNMKVEFISDVDGIMVKDFLYEKGYSRTFLRKAKLRDFIYINGKKAKNYEKIFCGDEISVIVEEELNESFSINGNELEILYEDEYLLIVNKPYELAIQPSRKHQNDNLISMISNYYIKKNIATNVHIVTRLDFSTSGIVMVAKSGFIHHLLSKEVIIKKYFAIIKGQMQEKSGIIRLPIRREKEENIKRWVFPDGKMSVTKYQVIYEKENNSLVDVELLTGRTHQIRVHFAYLNHPLIGDKIYGDGSERMYLHCYFVKFNHPIYKKDITITKNPVWLEENKNA